MAGNKVGQVGVPRGTSGAVSTGAVVAVVVMFAVVAVVAAAVVVIGRSSPSTTAASAAPTAAPATTSATALASRYDGSAFDRPFRMDLPAWVMQNFDAPSRVDGERVYFNLCPGKPDCMGLDIYAFPLMPDRAGLATYRGLLASYEKLDREGAIALYDKKVTSVGGREMTTFSVTTKSGSNEGLGCFSDGTCAGFMFGYEDRFALVDAVGGPLLISNRSFAENPWNKERLPQLATVLATLELLPSPPRTLPPEMQGTWQARLSPEGLASTLGSANLSGQVPAATKGLGLTAAGLDLRLTVVGNDVRLAKVDSASDRVLDEHSCSRVADKVVCISKNDSGVDTLVLRWSLADPGLRLEFVSSVGPPAIPGVPNEALQRPLYTATTWVKAA